MSTGPRRLGGALLLLLTLAPLPSLAQGGPDVAPWLKPKGLLPRAMGTEPMGGMAPAHGGKRDDTQCELCHTAQAWTPATFAHDRTGFPLKGAHASAPCKGCHVQDFKAPLPRVCSGCHPDAHQGDFGQRCEGCHAEDSWKAFFTADAHRRTNFPLVGRHAILPCTECHTQMLDRRFVRATVDCLQCHANDYSSTVSTPVNHPLLGFSTRCRDCHTPYAWLGAHFAEHDSCFLISSGPHDNIQCLHCHTSLVGAQMTGACMTNTAACSACHVHLCSQMDIVHATVQGYQCKDRKCYECHRFAKGP